jgi:PAS domain S-box-containing protein
MMMPASNGLTGATERPQVQTVLPDSETRYRSLFEHMLEGLAYCRMLCEQGQPRDFVYLEVNPAFERLTGLKDVVGRKVTEVIPGIREANPQLFEICGRVAAGGPPERFETYLSSLGVWFAVSVYGPAPEHFVAVFNNVTEHRQAEEKLRAVNRTLQMISECNQALVRATTEPELLDTICRNVVELGGYPLAWVGFAAADAPASLRVAAHAGSDREFLELARTVCVRAGQKDGPTGVALRTGQSVVCADLRGDPNACACRQDALQRGYASMISVPLLTDGRAFGALTIYAAGPGAFDAPEVKLLEELAGDLSFGIATLRIRAEHRQAEAALRAAHERLQRFVDANIVGILIVNAAGHIIEANDYYLRLIGFTRAELARGQADWRALTPPEWLPADEQAIRELRERGTCRPYEKEYLRRDGTRVPVLLVDALLPGPEEQIAAFALDLTDRKQAEARIQQQLEELRRWQAVMLGREDHSMKLKREVNELLRRLGEPIRYPSQEEPGAKWS